MQLILRLIYMGDVVRISTNKQTSGARLKICRKFLGGVFAARGPQDDGANVRIMRVRPGSGNVFQSRLTGRYVGEHASNTGQQRCT